MHSYLKLYPRLLYITSHDDEVRMSMDMLVITKEKKVVLYLFASTPSSVHWQCTREANLMCLKTREQVLWGRLLWDTLASKQKATLMDMAKGM